MGGHAELQLGSGEVVQLVLSRLDRTQRHIHSSSQRILSMIRSLPATSQGGDQVTPTAFYNGKLKPLKHSFQGKHTPRQDAGV